MLTQMRLKELLLYDPETGVFTWLSKPNRSIRMGDVAGCMASGYRQIKIDGRLYRAHRLAWLYVHGKWPADQIDHINGVRDDNRIVNLREATQSQNQQNRTANANNTSGFPGVCWSKQKRKWRSQIKLASRNKYLGIFDTPVAAHAAYLAAKAELHTFQPITRDSQHGEKEQCESL